MTLRDRIAPTCALLAGLLLLATTSVSATVFNPVSTTTVTPYPTNVHGIALVGSEWFLGNFNSGWDVYDLGFNLQGTTTTDVPTGATRGVVYDPNSGNMFIGDYNTDIIYEVTTGGTVVNSFSSTVGALNALAFNPTNDHVFALDFNGGVVELTRTGGFVGSFVATGTWTGMAYDVINDTLLILDSSLDFVREYSTAGAIIDTPLPGDAVAGNGQGLHYDSNTGTLHVTGQSGDIAVWQRDTPIPVESTTWGSVKAMFDR